MKIIAQHDKEELVGLKDSILPTFKKNVMEKEDRDVQESATGIRTIFIQAFWSNQETRVCDHYGS